LTLAGMLDGLDRALIPLDTLRRGLYRLAVPWLGPWIRSRAVRAGLNGGSVVVVSLILALWMPLVLLAVGPLLLGVPHLLADTRYLVVRPGLHQRPAAWIIGALLVLSSVLVDLRIGMVAAGLMPLLAQASWPRRLLAVSPILLLLLALFLQRWPTTTAIAHGHNVVAVVVWMTLGFALHPSTSEATFARVVPSLLVLLGGGLLLSGTLEPYVALSIPGMPPLKRHLAELAPGLDPAVGTRWVVTFAYAQAVHYGLWLRVIPEEDRDRPAPRSWRASLRTLRADFGDPWLAAFGMVFVGLAGWGLVDLMAARTGYLRLALFHGPLEFGVLALVLAEGRGALRS
jgi:hypothetical protein